MNPSGIVILQHPSDATTHASIFLPKNDSGFHLTHTQGQVVTHYYFDSKVRLRLMTKQTGRTDLKKAGACPHLHEISHGRPQVKLYLQRKR
jgi:hypothetical protein